MKILCFLTLLLIAATTHAQDCGGMANAGGTCVPPDVAMPGYQQRPQSTQALPQVWVNYWGAMVSDDSKGALGVASDKQSEAKAWQAAKQDCLAKGGLNCTKLISYENECIAMAFGEKTYSFATGKTEEDASRKANGKCVAHGNLNCRIYYSACSLPFRIQ